MAKRAYNREWTIMRRIEIGRAVGDYMSAHNAAVSAAAWQRLGLKPRDRVLEVGFGNGKLIPALLALEPELERDEALRGRAR